MVPWNALPWNTILAIIGISLLIPSLLAAIFIKIKRYEDCGLAIGLFLLILGSISYGYLIPQQVVHETILPENYIWEDQGIVHYWERNSVLLKGKILGNLPFNIAQALPQREPIERTFIGKEVIHISDFDHEKNQAYINDVIYDDSGEIFHVINNTENVSEWYWIDSHTTSLRYTTVSAGYMGIPSALDGVNIVPVGWVESKGEQNGKENVVLVRDMQRIAAGSIDGVEVAVWQSNVYNKAITWHGQTYYCDETLQLTVNPATGYVIHVYRHLMLSARMSQFIQLYYPAALHSRVISNYLKFSDPVGEAAELTYNTTLDAQKKHLADASEIGALITYVPLAICIPMFIIGTMLTWRYWGRSYYWKRYKEYEQQGEPASARPKRRGTRRKTYAVVMIAILVCSSAGYLVYRESMNQGPNMKIPVVTINNTIPEPQDIPTPPGSSRTIDSGRHVLLPSDEGVHKFSGREWWYFNVFFNDVYSDLYNYSLIVSFNHMKTNDIRFLKPDNLFIFLYDPNGTNYNFATENKRRGTLQAKVSGVDVTFESSWVKGTYPSWHVHGVNAQEGFIVDLDYTADFLPVWVEGRSANLPIAKYVAGDYYIPRCKVNGTITWNGKQYNVSGMGYHDHVWERNVPRFITKGWDWANVHFDNGWEMYFSKFIIRAPLNPYSGAIIISPNNRNLTEFNKFKITFTESATPQGFPFMVYPKKFHLEAERDGMVLKLDFDIYNICQNLFKRARTGLFEGPCRVTGTFSWSGYTVDLHGYGLTEITRVKYLIGLPETVT